MSNWPRYESHKIVQAAKIVSIADGVIYVDPHGSAEPEVFEPSVDGMAAKAEVGGYAILYPDGFKSISPAKAFEEGYTRAEPNAAELGAAARRLGLTGA